MHLDFADRTAVVTGGAQGIGLAVARALAEAGAAVDLWDRQPDPVARAAAGMPRASARVVDVTDRVQVDAAVADLIERSGRVDVLVNNAGIVRDAQLVRVAGGAITGGMTGAEFDAVIDVNLKGVFHCTQAVAPHMIARGYGRIVNASSVVGLYGNFGQTSYVAAKAGVIGMTRVWARELGRHGITVNAVAPGFVDTDMVAQVPPKIVARMLERTPVGRLGRPEDVAAAYVFLASAQAAFVNGAVLSVDGGLVTGT